jgi:hypothetical protein
VFWHWIHLCRRSIKAWKQKVSMLLVFCRMINKINRICCISSYSLHCCSLTSFMFTFT